AYSLRKRERGKKAKESVPNPGPVLNSYPGSTVCVPLMYTVAVFRYTRRGHQISLPMQSVLLTTEPSLQPSSFLKRELSDELLNLLRSPLCIFRK
uniref:Uncharacterized protein n=1 Tax=Mus spicilegus TaxID=10103 RepID=A0A8C6IHV7_MUSSI